MSFIEDIVEGAKETQTKYGVFASVIIGQAIHESAWGTSYLATTDNNLFGIKYAGNHDPDIVITEGTLPTDGSQTGVYCHYESWDDSIMDHGYFLKNNSRYTEAGVFSATTSYDQLVCIFNGGYAEDPDYVSKVWAIIEENNLTQYDSGVTPPDPPDPPDPSGNYKLIKFWYFGKENLFLYPKIPKTFNSYELIKIIGDKAILKNIKTKTIICVNKKYIKNT